MSFKVGDRVMCVNDAPVEFTGLVKGMVYTVQSTFVGKDAPMGCEYPELEQEQGVTLTERLHADFLADRFLSEQDFRRLNDLPALA